MIIESPYAGDVERNLRYAKACMQDCFNRGESPFASHVFYTQEGLLDDSDPEERELGIEAGFAWRECADLTVFYIDLGWSKGMVKGFEHVTENGLPWVCRKLGDDWNKTTADL